MFSRRIWNGALDGRMHPVHARSLRTCARDPGDPGGLVVEGQLTVCFTRITALPEELKVRGRIATNGTRIPVFVQTVRDDEGYIAIPGLEAAPGFGI